VGKSSLFNRLTGSAARVGNFPGVTVEVLEGPLRLPNGQEAMLYDLPGLYVFGPAIAIDTDEHIAFDFVATHVRRDRPFLVVHVIDANQLALGLGLTRDLLRYRHDLPLLVVLNQTDALAAEGYHVDVESLQDALGYPVVAVSARQPESKAQLLSALETATSSSPTTPLPRPLETWDPHLVAQRCVLPLPSLPTTPSPRQQTERLDVILLHPVVGPLCALVTLTTMFLVIFLVADPASALFDLLFQKLGLALRPWLGGGWLASLVVDGIFGGAGTVLAFLPQILLLMGAMELLESTGYLARIAFLVDRGFRALGLGGKSLFPLLTAHACAVPAITATRILHDPKERLLTILVLPLMTCSARLPVYSLLISAFFSGSAWRKATIFLLLYASGIVTGFLAALVLRRTISRGRRTLPLVLEMPVYRRPDLRIVGQRCLRESKEFVWRTGTIIVLASIFLWVLLTVPVRSGAADTLTERSVAAALGHLVEPLTRPLGFDWRINVGLIGSFGARELMVGTLGVMFGIDQSDASIQTSLAEKIAAATLPNGQPAYTLATAVSLLAFFVIACQCISTVSAVRRETKSWRWPLFLLTYTYALAYAVSLVAYQTTRFMVR